MSLHDQIKTGSRITRAMSVQSAIHWAFVNEKVRLDFDRYGAHEFDREGIDPIWRGMRIAELGTVVDGGGGGSSRNAAFDARIIADRIESLPISAIDPDGVDHDGYRLTERSRREVAIRVVQHAISGIAPDWGKHERLRIQSVEMVWCARGRDFYGLVANEGSTYVWRDKYRNKREAVGEVCPVVCMGSPEAIRVKRWRYHAWCGVLLHLWHELRQPGVLDAIKITNDLPPLNPWSAT
jgi:hypothetical protein